MVVDAAFMSMRVAHRFDCYSADHPRRVHIPVHELLTIKILKTLLSALGI
jgi:hypothetical protein